MLVTGTPDTYDITITRDAEQAVFWIEGPDSIVEGYSITLNCRSNRVVPAGNSVTVNFTYSGTLTGTEYTPTASAVMAENTDIIQLVIPITDDAISEVPETLTVTVDSITNTAGAFQAVGIGTKNSKTVNVYDNDSLSLVMN